MRGWKMRLLISLAQSAVDGDMSLSAARDDGIVLSEMARVGELAGQASM